MFYTFVVIKTFVKKEHANVKYQKKIRSGLDNKNIFIFICLLNSFRYESCKNVPTAANECPNCADVAIIYYFRRTANQT